MNLKIAMDLKICLAVQNFVSLIQTVLMKDSKKKFKITTGRETILK